MNTNKLTASAQYNLHLGDNLATLKNYPDNTFDSIVTDPPYGIDFLGKEWDSHTGTVELYKECLRVLKPGGYLLAFSAARTYHKLAYSVELAGFEIRDQLMWLYSSGFPKAQDIGKAIQKRLGVVETRSREDLMGAGVGLDNWSTNLTEGVDKRYAEVPQQTVCTDDIAKQWEGYKTALKPAHEPIVMARKPFKGSTIDNVLKNGLGAMNIDATRVPWADDNSDVGVLNRMANDPLWAHGDKVSMSNILAEATGAERVKRKKSDKPKPQPLNGNGGDRNFAGAIAYIPAADDAEMSVVSDAGRYPSNVIGEVAEGYQKYFYCPKVSRKERHSGFDDSESLSSQLESVGGYLITRDGKKTSSWIEGEPFIPGVGRFKCHGVKHEVEKIRKAQGITTTNIGNNHPTVKPVALMEYLIKLVTPPSTPTLQRKVLDPFMGSGSTGMAVTKLGHHFTGCELDAKYVAIAATRIDAWNDDGLDKNLFE